MSRADSGERSAARAGVPALIPVLVLVLVIGPTWLVTRDLFEGATVSFAAATGLRDGLYFWYTNANWPLGVAFYKLLFAASDATAIHYQWFVKLVVTALLLGLYLEFNALGRRLFGWAPDEARRAALVCIASPAAYIFINSGVTPILLCIWLMFAGHRLYWDGPGARRVLGWALVAASFQLNSNLVFALALNVGLMAAHPSQWRLRARWFLVLLATAVAVYAVMRQLMPPRQLYIEYNQLLSPLRPDDLKRMLRAVAMFLTWGALPLAATAAVLVAVWLRRAPPVGAPRDAGAGDPPTRGWQGLATAVFLCAAAVFPYVMVGKGAPLFTWLGADQGLTAQVLREVYGGPLAPTWASTSARHALLYSFMLGFLCWSGARLLPRLWGRPPLPAGLRLALLLAVQLAWLLPAYANKLGNQYVELSLAEGLAALPPAPAGLVDLRYSPVRDELIWTNVGAGILRDAWGKSHYFAMMHAVDVYREDLQWQYHAYIKDPGGLGLPVVQHMNAMDGLPGEDCISRYKAVLPQASWADVMLAGLSGDRVRPAAVTLVESGCEPGRVLPNPKPDKKVIP